MSAKVYVQTFGCTLNQSDSRVMKGILVKDGYTIVEDAQDADVIVVNSCTVKGKTIRNFRKSLREHEHKPIVVAGCVPEASPHMPEIASHNLVGTNHLSSISHAVDNALHDHVEQFLGKGHEDRIGLEQFAAPDMIGIVPISKGCLSSCSYCMTKKARGHLASFPIEHIVKYVQSLLEKGVKQFWLTSQDCSAYGLDIKSNMALLLEAIVALEGDFKVRIGMANPLFFHQFQEKLVEVMQSPKMYKFLHIPVQSGSDKVLKVMRRGYVAADFIEMVTYFQERIPDLTLATDIIIGHPGETEEDFKQTLRLLGQVKPQVVNFSRFSAHEGTKAATLEQIPKDVIDERMQRFKAFLFSQLNEINATQVGWQGSVIVEQHRRGGTMMCRTDTYRPVVVEGRFPIGKNIKVSIKGYTPYHLKGCVE